MRRHTRECEKLAKSSSGKQIALHEFLGKQMPMMDLGDPTDYEWGGKISAVWRYLRKGSVV